MNLRKPIIFLIGPVLLSKEVKTIGGIASYIEGFLNTDMPKKYCFRFLNSQVPGFFVKYRFLRPILSFYFLLKLLFILTFIKPRPQLAHIHVSSGLSFWEKSLFGLVCKVVGIKIVLHLHGHKFDVFFFSGSRLKRSLIIKTLLGFDKHIVLSQSWYDMFTKLVPADKLVVIPNAIDTKLYFNRNPVRNENDFINILFVGSIGRRKGLIDLALSIKSLIDDNITNFRVDLLGGEENYGEFKKIIKIYNDLKLEPYVRFHGPVLGISKIEFFHHADIFILPSYNESFGIVNLEGMASGLPIISTKVGAIPEYIISGENGFLIEPGNVDELTRYLKIMIEDEGLRKKMGENNLTKVWNEFDWSKVSKEIDALYKSLLEPKRFNSKSN